MTSRRPALAPLALALALLLGVGAPARAEADEWALSLGPGLRILSESPADDIDASTRFAIGLASGLRYGLDDFWQAGMSLDAGLTTDADLVGSLTAELHYVLDIVTWVPYLTLGVGALVRDAPTATASSLRTDLLVTLGGGIEYRPERDFAIGLSARYELVPTDFSRVASAFHVALCYVHFFE